MSARTHHRRAFLKPLVLAGAVALLAVLSLLPASANPGPTERVSVDSAGNQGYGDSAFPVMTPDGRFVSFQSDASNLVANDNNAGNDIFVRDRQTGVTERISVSLIGGDQNNPGGTGFIFDISADGRFVAFSSSATNLVAGDGNGRTDAFVRDRLTGTTERVSVASDGTEGNATSFGPAISADGRFVAFVSFASNLVAGDTSGADVFVHDRQSGATERITADGPGAAGTGARVSISADGRIVAFRANRANLVTGDTNGVSDIFVYDRVTDTTVRVSVDSAGVQGNSFSTHSAISADGRFVAFSSVASNLVAGDTNNFCFGFNCGDVFVHDRQTGATTRVSVDSAGNQGNGQSFHLPDISADGRFVAFRSQASNLVAGDNNSALDVFVHDRLSGTTERASVSSAGNEANADNGRLDINKVSITADGRFVAFESFASNLVASDTNTCEDLVFPPFPPFPPVPVIRNCSDVFVHDREAVGVDSDGDGIPDADDACPDTAAGVTVDANGCTPDQGTENVIGELQTIVGAEGCPAACTELGAKVRDALVYTQTALNELAKTPPDNQAAAGAFEGAVGDLEEAIGKGSPEQDAVLVGLMDQLLAETARLLAVTAIDAAIGGDPVKIMDAQQLVADGDALREDGAFKDAVAKYKDAVAKAESA